MVTNHPRVIVTGANGRVGSYIVRELREHGMTVIPVDRTPASDGNDDTVIVELTDFDAVDAAFSSNAVDAVIHVAGLPGRSQASGNVVFENNLLASYGVFSAARRYGVRHLIFCSSETLLGLPFDEAPPYIPVDESVSNRFSSDYGLSKEFEERLAELVSHWHPEMTIVGLILATVIMPDGYEQFREFEGNPDRRRYNLWSYVDVRDAAQAARRALGFHRPGFERFIIAAGESVLDRPSVELIEEAFGQISTNHELHRNESLLSIEKATKLLGYKPAHSWRTEILN